MVTEALPELPIFSGLTPEQIEELSGWLVRLEFLPGQEIFAEGSQPDGLYVVARGGVEVLRTTAAGVRRVAELEGPCVFGEMGFLNSEPHSAAIRALTRITAGLLPCEVYEQRLRENNLTALHIALNLGRVACSRLRVTTDKLLRLSEVCARQQPTPDGKAAVAQELDALCKHILKGEHT
jgi:CRP-like cAMP-binding protein